MDSNKMLIGFVVLIVGFLAFPIVVNKVKASGMTSAATTSTAPSTTTPSATAAPSRPPAAASDPKYSEPPLLNEQNLIGSNWQFFFQNYKVKLTFAANGVGYATHPMAKALTGLDYIEGRWHVQGNRLFLKANAGGNEIDQEFLISGNRIYQVKDGKPSGELERF